MTTAIIGVGQVGSALARHLVRGGEHVVLAARDGSHAALLTEELGPLATSASLSQAIADADTVVFAVWLDTLAALVAENAGLLPPEAHYVKAFGSLGAPSLAASTNRSPRRAVLFYATDDAQAVAAVERLILAAGFDPVQVGGLNDVARIEMPGGDLHQGGGLKGALLDADQARAAAAAATVA